MNIRWTELTGRVLNTLTETERQQSVVYFDTNVYEPGATVRLNRQVHVITQPTILAFIDLQPSANWGHPCRYVLLHPEHDGVESIDASFPPDATHLALAHRSDGIQDWMLLTTRMPGPL